MHRHRQPRCRLWPRNKQSNSEAKGSDAEGGSSSLKSDNSEIPTKTTPSTKGVCCSNPNTSQILSLPELDSKNFEEDQKVQWCTDAHLLDKDFGEWWDHMIKEGHQELDTHDKMTCKAKHPNHVELHTDYMRSHAVFELEKSNEYDLCHLYQVGVSRDLLKFPMPHEPATHEWVANFLHKARALGWPNLIMVHTKNLVTAVCLLQELHVKDSLCCILMEPKFSSPPMNFA